MKYWIVLVLLSGILAPAYAQSYLTVYEADGETLFDSRNIMVGTQLTCVVSVDCNDYWSGGIFVEGENRFLSGLSARNTDPNSRDYRGSHYDNAGFYANVTAWNDSIIWGFDFYGSDFNSMPGDWFIIDYEALEAGEPNVWFMDYSVSWDVPVLAESFTQVKSIDYNDDQIVNLIDFAILSDCWLTKDCQEPNWCYGADIDEDGSVDSSDLKIFADFWLWEPNLVPKVKSNESVFDPNFIYRIVDANGLDEITISTGQSIELFLSTEVNDSNCIKYYFDAEVNISDSNLGEIENTEYPNGDTIILLKSRVKEFDYWWPGYYQQEGLRVFCASFDPIRKGNVARFVYTANNPGDVTLSLVEENIDDVIYHNILIHQVDQDVQTSFALTSNNSSQVSESLSIEETVDALETIWNEDDGIKEVITEDEWETFIDTVKSQESIE